MRRTVSDKDHRLPLDECPYCGKKLDAVTGVGAPDQVDEAPDPGSLSVCIECAHILVFDDNLRLRKPFNGELVQIGKEDPEALRTIMMASVSIHEMHRRRGLQ